jgi:hypothetical protein
MRQKITKRQKNTEHVDTAGKIDQIYLLALKIIYIIFRLKNDDNKA